MAYSLPRPRMGHWVDFCARAGSIKQKTDDLRHRAFYKTAVNTEDNAHEDDLDHRDQDAGAGTGGGGGKDHDEDQDEYDGDFDDGGGDDGVELPSDADEAYEVICAMTGRTLAMLYQVRDKEPEAIVDGQDINELIVQLENFLARAKETQRALDEVTQRRIECYAELCLERNELPAPFWSFAATVGRYHYPAHPKIQLYYDSDDLQEYLMRLAPDPIHLLN